MFAETSLHGLRDRMLALRSLPNFAGVRDESLLYVVESSRERRFMPGEILFDEATPVDHVYFLVGGKITITRHGKPFLVVEGAGGIGVIAALADDRLGWRAVADRESLALELPLDSFRENLEEDFGLLRNSLRLIAGMSLRTRGNLPVKPDQAKPAELGVYPERDATLVERVIALRSAPAGPFATANMDAIIDLCRGMVVERVDAGHTFWNVGDPTTFSLRLIYGCVRCATATGEHVDMGAGSMIGILDGWSGRPRSFSARAETPVVAYRTLNEASLAVLEMHPRVALQMLKGMARSLIAER
jgi:CRP-like cAMP-binding protein